MEENLQEVIENEVKTEESLIETVNQPITEEKSEAGDLDLDG